MAKVKITGHASGSGIIELTAPNTSTNRTITLPDATGTLLTEVADNAITLAKMASGTDGNIISYDASGNPVAIATGSDGQVLTSAGAGQPPAFETASSFNPNAAVVLNESGADVDFRVEADTNASRITAANALFLEGSTGNVVLGSGTNTDDSVNLLVTRAGYTSMEIYASENSSARDAVLRLHTRSGGAQCRIYMLDNAGAGDVGGQIEYNHDGDKMIFHTANAERLQIGNTGKIGIGGAADCMFTVRYNGWTQANGISMYDSYTGSQNNNFLLFYRNGNAIGSITNTASATAYNTSSDYRLKENVDYTWDATTRLKQLKPARFNFIVDDTNTLVDGFIAHEVSSVVPEAIHGVKDAMTAEVLYVYGDELPEGKSIGDVKTASGPDYQGIDQSKLVPLLVKTIQELEARITALEA